MAGETNDSGLLAAMVADFESGKMPRALAMLDKVRCGDLLDDIDIAFLEQLFFEAHSLIPLFNCHPEYQDIGAQILGLCEEITHAAFENELSSSTILH